MDADMKRMMAEMQASIQALATQTQASIQGLAMQTQASIQALATEMRTSIKGLEGRFDGLEGRLDKKFNGLSMQFVQLDHKMDVKHDKAVEKMMDIYRHAAWAAESARASAQKGFTHGPMLIDHEDRIRALEGKRKTRPAA